MQPKFILLCSMIISALSLNAQEEEVKKTRNKNNEYKKWSAGLAIGITPLPDNQASLLPGIEYFIDDRFSVYNEVALHLDKSYHADSAVLNKKYFRYKAEFRYYFSMFSYPFLGLQFTTATRKFDIEKGGNYFERKQGDSTWVFDRASVNSPFIATTLQLGTIKRLIKELFLESSIGCGFKVVNTEYKAISNLRKDRYSGLLNFKPIASYRYIGKNLQCHFTFFMRLSYHF